MRPSNRHSAHEGSKLDKRRTILHAAVRVFADKGYHGCRIADVAKEAQVAYGLVYHYFHNKEALLESVFEEQWTLFLKAIESISEGPADALEQLTGICRFAVDAFKMAPAAVRVLILEVARTPSAFQVDRTRQSLEDAVRRVSAIVARGQARRELRPDLDPMVAAACLMGALEISLTGMVLGTLGHAGPGGLTEDEVEAVKRGLVDFVTGGVALVGR